ncbi:hypothetical protein TELCIR_09701 [Teladorsagia circumcincta]|uniref:GPI ethanolamine phosphate transferase 2 n=1 Tax=Teladorsagia circumcincta TaxID=45464 RepID=A0A2G9UE50_TELCI|nr:hypothetical protein TELCIR_09701 [Teladorsagia circumcincta]
MLCSTMIFEELRRLTAPEESSVDNNVTRHLDSVLRNCSWDVLVLHYLGLDHSSGFADLRIILGPAHLGHSLGSQSPEIKMKLKEMDGIAQQVFNIVSAQYPLLLVVVGDHGMTNAGNHGGGTEAETHVPMVFLHSTANVTKRGNVKDLKSVEQVDFATTLPFFLRVPIPSSSVGLSLIPQLASQWLLSDSTVFSSAFQSAVHFSKFVDGGFAFLDVYIKAEDSKIDSNSDAGVMCKNHV